jgi:hypothetical protein
MVPYQHEQASRARRSQRILSNVDTLPQTAETMIETEAGHSHLRIEAETGSRSRITADAFAFPGFDGEVTRAAAGSASW